MLPCPVNFRFQFTPPAPDLSGSHEGPILPACCSGSGCAGQPSQGSAPLRNLHALCVSALDSSSSVSLFLSSSSALLPRALYARGFALELIRNSCGINALRTLCTFCHPLPTCNSSGINSFRTLLQIPGVGTPPPSQ